MGIISPYLFISSTIMETLDSMGKKKRKKIQEITGNYNEKLISSHLKRFCQMCNDSWVFQCLCNRSVTVN